MILEKRAECVQAILAAIRFRMLHVLIDTTDVPLILCGYEIWRLTSQEEHKWRVCERRMVRRIFDVRGR